MSFEQAVQAYKSGRLADAEGILRQILNRDARNFDALHLLAIVCSDLARFEQAEKLFQAAISIDSRFPPVFHNFGLLLSKMRRYEPAVTQFDRALALFPNFAPVYSDRGCALTELDRLDEALASHDKAVSLAPNVPMAWNNRATAQFKKKNYALALKDYDQALKLNADYASAWTGRGNVSYQLKHYDEALTAFAKAIALRAHDAEAWLGRGNVLWVLRRYDEALAAFNQALLLDPNLAEAWHGRGNVFHTLRRYQEAFAAYDKAFALKPLLDGTQDSRLFTKMSICDWSNFGSEWGHLISALRSGSIAPDPFQIMAGPTSTADHAKCAEIYTDKYCSSAEQFSPSQRDSHARIRVAYVSPDFREHPIAHLLAGLFEHHDRSRFETIAIALGPDDDSEMRARLKSAFDRFIDVHDKTDLEAARLVRELGVDIVVDLAGFTTGCRPAILAHRPAPLQITYLSYPGIAKKAFIDYILADPVVIPEDQRALFGQPIVDLPGTYLGYDSSQKISGNPPTRLEQGLPNDGVVFCAFNNTFKIGPELFGIWMRILRQSDNSVLWLSGTSDAAVANLRHEAEARGIDADRLCFAPYMKSRADHLGRYRLADLFLDTLPFNAQTTACDALWAGLPVLSRLGSTFVGRVAASVLGVMGLPELITHSEEEYEALALKLAKNPSMIADLKNKVALNRHTCRIFDPERFRRGIEAAYEAIYERYQKGLPPCHIRIQS